MTKITRGTENVFGDIGVPDPDTQMLKAELVLRIAGLIESKKLSQSAAAKLMALHSLISPKF